MGVRGDFGSIKALKQRLRDLPRSIAHEVAARGGPAMTDLTRQAFAAGVNVYDEPRPAGVDGQPLTLEQSGATRGQLQFVVTGTIIRCALGTRWAKYLIGKYGILPNGGLPARWAERLRGFVKEAGRNAL